MPVKQPHRPDPVLPRRYATLPEAAVYVGVSLITIRRRIADGSITAYRMGPRLLRVDLNELDAIPAGGR